MTALVLIFKSRAIWPSTQDRPDTNRQSDANVASSQNVISHTPLDIFLGWEENTLEFVDSNQTISSFQAE